MSNKYKVAGCLNKDGSIWMWIETKHGEVVFGTTEFLTDPIDEELAVQKKEELKKKCDKMNAASLKNKPLFDKLFKD
jgi:uncharacterized protein YpmB